MPRNVSLLNTMKNLLRGGFTHLQHGGNYRHGCLLEPGFNSQASDIIAQWKSGAWDKRSSRWRATLRQCIRITKPNLEPPEWPGPLCALSRAADVEDVWERIKHNGSRCLVRDLPRFRKRIMAAFKPRDGKVHDRRWSPLPQEGLLKGLMYRKAFWSNKKRIPWAFLILVKHL